MKLFRSRFLVVCIAIALVLVLVPSVFAAIGRTDLLRSGLMTVSKPFSIAASKVADAVNGFTDIFTDYDRLKEENAALRAEVEELRSQEHNAEVIQNENEWLKGYLQFHNAHPDYILTDARIVAREAGNYATVLTLDRGTVHGVKAKMPVIFEGGLFGYVSEAGLDWCRVVTVVETASSVGVYTDRTGVSGVAEGDPALRNGGNCRMTYIDADADIRVGDLVYTNGAGSMYPAGLLLGKVVAIEADEATRSLVAEIEPAVDFTAIDRIDRLVIVCGYTGTTGGNK